MLIDVHAHLDDTAFQEDLDNVLYAAKAEGVSVIITNGTAYESNEKTLALAKKHALIQAALGIHPQDVSRLTDTDVDKIIEQIKNNSQKIIAIGEVGLDAHWQPADIERQKKILHILIHLAHELDKPLIVHTRDAEEETLAVLHEEKAKKVVLHAFGGNKKMVKQATEEGYFFSIPPNIVRSHHFQMITELVPATQLLTETDCPYLGPTKEGRNEPKYIRMTIQKIAEIKKMSEEDVEKQIEKNYQQLFLQEMI